MPNESKSSELSDPIPQNGIPLHKKKIEWKEYKLGEVANLSTRKMPISEVVSDNYISTENMIENKGGVKQASSIPGTGNATKYSVGDILISNIRPYFKKIWMANRNGGCSNDVLCLVPNEELVNRKYLYYTLCQDVFFDYVMLGSKGCKMPRGDKSHIMNWRFVFPPLSEQKRIASILSSLDDKIDLLHRQNATLEAMAEALFRHHFIENGDGGVCLGDVIKTTSGGTPSRKNDEYYFNGTIGWVKSKELRRQYIFESEEEITEKAMHNSSAKILPENTVLIAMYGATVGEYGILAEPFACNQAICALIPNEKYPYTYLYLWAKYMRDEFLNLACGAAQQNISQDLIKQQRVSDDFERISCFHELAKFYLEKMKNNGKQIQTLTQVRNRLLQKLISNREME